MFNLLCILFKKKSYTKVFNYLFIYFSTAIKVYWHRITELNIVQGLSIAYIQEKL